MIITHYRPQTSCGWELDVKRFYSPATLNTDHRPIVMIPGYCMNTFILSYHPRGTSMVSYLVEKGFEVWTANLRGQGDSQALTKADNYGFKQLALLDFPEVKKCVQTNTLSGAEKIDVVGCSLGATILYTYMAHNPADHQIEAMVSIGGPLRWDDVHPILRLASKSPDIAAAMQVKGTRQVAQAIMPLIQKAPFLVSFYMNPNLIDLSKAGELIKTIDDPHGHLSRQVAHWVQKRDLIVDSLNISHALSEIDIPVLCILANADGIVPPAAVLSVKDYIGSQKVDSLEVGTKKMPFAHADLFVADNAHKEVFEPLGNWLIGNYDQVSD